MSGRGTIDEALAGVARVRELGGGVVALLSPHDAAFRAVRTRVDDARLVEPDEDPVEAVRRGGTPWFEGAALDAALPVLNGARDTVRGTGATCARSSRSRSPATSAPTPRSSYLDGPAG